VSNVERAFIDARFGDIMQDMGNDSVFMWYYNLLEARCDQVE
jgi:hypothetical protein